MKREKSGEKGFWGQENKTKNSFVERRKSFTNRSKYLPEEEPHNPRKSGRSRESERETFQKRDEKESGWPKSKPELEQVNFQHQDSRGRSENETSASFDSKKNAWVSGFWTVPRFSFSKKEKENEREWEMEKERKWGREREWKFYRRFSSRDQVHISSFASNPLSLSLFLLCITFSPSISWLLIGLYFSSQEVWITGSRILTLWMDFSGTKVSMTVFFPSCPPSEEVFVH